VLPGHPLSLDEFRFVSALMWEENVMYINGWFQKRNRGHIVPSGNHKVQDLFKILAIFPPSIAIFGLYMSSSD